jgi:hypothetical protein
MRHFLPANPHTIRGDCRIHAAQKAQFPPDCAKPVWREENAAKKQIEAWFRFNRDEKSSRVTQRVESGYGQPDNP